MYFDKQDPHVEEHMVASRVNNNGETMFAPRKVLTEQNVVRLVLPGSDRQAARAIRSKDTVLKVRKGLKAPEAASRSRARGS